MVYLLKYSSIFMPLSRKKHHQVAGIPINGLFWDLLKHTTVSKNQQPSLGKMFYIRVCYLFLITFHQVTS